MRTFQFNDITYFKRYVDTKQKWTVIVDICGFFFEYLEKNKITDFNDFLEACENPIHFKNADNLSGYSSFLQVYLSLYSRSKLIDFLAL